MVDHPARFCVFACGMPRGDLHGTALCVGSALEFLTEAQQRAPAMMQRAGLEWLHRPYREPRRLGGGAWCSRRPSSPCCCRNGPGCASGGRVPRARPEATTPAGLTPAASVQCSPRGGCRCARRGAMWSWPVAAWPGCPPRSRRPRPVPGWSCWSGRRRPSAAARAATPKPISG
ncbi:WecB/TagA/CpsF family glycosyltransferase [Paeniroseomonas aquatica]|uniref:WecB/TagA/CpsF family glycosyltransferase n=1 Tax=Paeniroseomonas aquatica TaxID=373043 RepID=UPI00361CB213